MAQDTTAEHHVRLPLPEPGGDVSLLRRIRRWLSFLGWRRSTPERSTAFTIAIVSLSAKLAKSDGVATKIEADTFHRLHDIVPDEQDRVRRVFDKAAQDLAGFDAYASEVKRLLGGERGLLRNVLEGLFHIAAADGILHPEEERYLRRAAEIFGLSDEEFRTLRGLFVHDPDDAFAILGLGRDASNAAIKSRYRELVRQHHPDALVGAGMPAQYVRFATAKLAEINRAYEQIAKERGL